MLIKFVAQLVLTAILSAGFIFSSTAATVEGLYQGQVKVENQLANTRRKALTQALAQVLIKLTGNQDYLEQQSVKQLLTAANQYLLGYRYDAVDGQLLYVANFDEQKVNNAIRQAGLPIWGKRRPDTLVWFAFQTDSVQFERELVHEKSSNLLSQTLLSTAQQRGIHMRLPIMDLTAKQAVSVYDVWAEFIQNIADESSHYGTDYVLSFRLLPQSYQAEVSSFEDATVSNGLPYVFLSEQELTQKGLTKQELSWQYFLQQQALKASLLPAKNNLPWRLEWNHFNPTQIHPVRHGTLFAESAEQAVVDLVNLIADMMASEFAFSLDQENNKRMSLNLAGISSLTNYKHCLDFLQSLVIVDRVTLIKQSGTIATIELNVNGTEQDLKNALLLDGRITPRLNEFGVAAETFDYIWQP